MREQEVTQRPRQIMDAPGPTSMSKKSTGGCCWAEGSQDRHQLDMYETWISQRNWVTIKSDAQMRYWKVKGYFDREPWILG